MSSYDRETGRTGEPALPKGAVGDREHFSGDIDPVAGTAGSFGQDGKRSGRFQQPPVIHWGYCECLPARNCSGLPDGSGRG